LKIPEGHRGSVQIDLTAAAPGPFLPDHGAPEDLLGINGGQKYLFSSAHIRTPGGLHRQLSRVPMLPHNQIDSWLI
jgi:hypothetical protein